MVDELLLHSPMSSKRSLCSDSEVDINKDFTKDQQLVFWVLFHEEPILPFSPLLLRVALQSGKLNKFGWL